MDHILVKFNLQSNILWSDGNQLTAEDSQFFYQTATRLFPNVNPDVTARARNDYALNPSTILWWTTTGYGTPEYLNGFFTPLPENTWGDLDREAQM